MAFARPAVNVAGVEFCLESPFQPQGDQPRAIEALMARLRAGEPHSVLLGVTGSGKTFTLANVIAQLRRPTLILSHNKTLAAQLYSEFRQFFPQNAVEYFVSYFDYYQPEAYLPASDTYIEKDSSINDDIDRLRLSATSSLLTRRDVIVVASVSCIYGLGSPEDYQQMLCLLERGKPMSREHLLGRLVEMLYERNDVAPNRGKFRVRGEVVEIYPAYDERGLRVEFFGDEIESLRHFDPLTGNALGQPVERFILFPARHYVTPHDKLRRAIGTIRTELKERIAELESQERLVEAQRLKIRTQYDLELMEELGFCKGIENYSRHLSGRPAGSQPSTLLEFFPDDFLAVIDESHATVPQVGAMYEGDRSRKKILVEHGFRLPSALDNRPLKFAEFEAILKQIIYVSATPGPYELKKTGSAVVEQIIRPTGLLDPQIVIEPLKGQIDNLIARARERVALGERVLVTTLTKKTAEDLADYLRDLGIRVQYLHSEIDAIERVEILRALRGGSCDVLVGINLLREGLDLPEVSLVAILDADKEGFLRSATSLIQTAGRAARHLNGQVVLYADKITNSIQELLSITERRRKIQQEYNEKHGITPHSVSRPVQEGLRAITNANSGESKSPGLPTLVLASLADADLAGVLEDLDAQMRKASAGLEYERAAHLRDQIAELRRQSEPGAAASAADKAPLSAVKKPTARKSGRKSAS